MNHDLEASWASSELARTINMQPKWCFLNKGTNAHAYAGRDGNTDWPFADGIIDVEQISGKAKHLIAVEYKRTNEGTHGVLTAIGQSHAYINKGFSASVMVLPETYPSLDDVGEYVKNVLKNTSNAQNIGICTYVPPDSSSAAPFKNKLTIHKPFFVDSPNAPIIKLKSTKIETQWAHVREGSTEPDAFFKYLTALKLVSGVNKLDPKVNIPRQLEDAVNRINPKTPVLNYLANCNGNGVHDDAWRLFWFTNVLFSEMLIGWKKNSSGKFEVNHILSKLNKIDGTGKKQWFSGKTNSIKFKCVEKLNSGAITEDQAWEHLALNFHERAHQYREDVDSGLEKIRFIEQTGRMTEAGYRFLEACERSKNANSALPMSLMAKSLLTSGGFNTFLHYVHKLSDEKFALDPFAFTKKISRKLKNKKISEKVKFDQEAYLSWLDFELSNNLRALRKVSKRGGVARKPLQGELAILRSFKLVGKGWRIGMGIPINWPEVQKVQENLK